MLYDTHLHFDILIEKLGLIDDDIHHLNAESWEKINNFILKTDTSKIKSELNRLCADHEFMIQSTVSLKNFHICRKLFGGLKKYFLMLGLHPEIIGEEFDLKNYLKEQKEYIKKHNIDIIGVGEIGLDYFYGANELVKEIQKNSAIEMIKFANDYNLPCIFHVRGKEGDSVWDDFFQIIKQYRPKNGFIVHCFTGGKDQMERIIKLDGLIGIGGISTFKNAPSLQEAIRFCPLENIVLETDLPYLAPMPHRGKICLPNHIELVLEKVSELKEMKKSIVLQTTIQSAKKVFRMNKPHKHGEYKSISFY